MCTNYRSPDEDTGFSQLKIDLGLLYRRNPWDREVYPDYRAPIITGDPIGRDGIVAVFGAWPKFLQPDRLDDRGKKKKKFDTYNARGEDVGSKPLYAKAWRDGQRCLIPARWVVEPCWETGKNVWHRIGLTDWAPYCVAGIWKRYEDADGRVLIGMSMLTLNADDHMLMKRMHRPNDEKRSVVIIQPGDYDEWLHTTNVEAARSMLQLRPAEEMWAEPVPG
ncbi:SOS response-associated peptidase (plasmid) [Paraburkholderia acidicola]|uniref:Abasic site processing protein n=1 Tax=Paraburkholderia acidicola TaxID=1912599 RepID=A0ABV1LY84_9BURK